MLAQLRMLYLEMILQLLDILVRLFLAIYAVAYRAFQLLYHTDRIIVLLLDLEHLHQHRNLILLFHLLYITHKTY